jgi:hypothetical protein
MSDAIFIILFCAKKLLYFQCVWHRKIVLHYFMTCTEHTDSRREQDDSMTTGTLRCWDSLNFQDTEQKSHVCQFCLPKEQLYIQMCDPEKLWYFMACAQLQVAAQRKMTA